MGMGIFIKILHGEIMIIFGAETLGFSSESVVLAISILCFEEKINYDYDSLVRLTTEYKLSVPDQVDIGRTVDRSTYEWWKGRTPELRNRYLSPAGISISEMVDCVNNSIKVFSDIESSPIVLSRGYLSKFVLESLYRNNNSTLSITHKQWKETGTMLDCLKESSVFGYCSVDIGLNYCQANLMEKTAYDAYMLLKGY